MLKRKTKVNKEYQEKLDKIFDSYGNGYDTSTVDNIERQKYIYYKLHEKGLENTNIEKLLDLLIDDVHHQYSLKNDIENKGGFILALWGVLLATVLQQEILVSIISTIADKSSYRWMRIFYFLLLAGLVLLVACTLINVTKLFLEGEFSKYRFSDKERCFKCAVDDKYMSLVQLLDSHTEAWTQNEDTNEKRYEYLKKVVISVIIQVVLIIVIYMLQRV